MASYYDIDQVEQYIRQKATSMGIDPNVAVKVARSEGLGQGIWQSNYQKGGYREPSYGPFQLLKGGQGTGFPEGMGNQFQKATNLDPSDPKNVYQGIDFALNHAKNNGWGAWYGAGKVGVGKWDGIGGTPSGTAPTTPTNDVQVASNSPSSGNTQAPANGSGNTAPPSVIANIIQGQKAPDGSTKGGILSALTELGKGPDAPEIRPMSSGAKGPSLAEFLGQYNQSRQAAAPKKQTPEWYKNVFAMNPFDSVG